MTAHRTGTVTSSMIIWGKKNRPGSRAGGPVKQLTALTAGNDSAQLLSAARRSYGEAISHYEYLLKKYPGGPDTTDLLYQLSRAYEESGQSQQALTSIDQLLAQEPASNLRLYADTRGRRRAL